MNIFNALQSIAESKPHTPIITCSNEDEVYESGVFFLYQLYLEPADTGTYIVLEEVHGLPTENQPSYEKTVFPSKDKLIAHINKEDSFVLGLDFNIAKEKINLNQPVRDVMSQTMWA